jgi:hypothetical protein
MDRINAKREKLGLEPFIIMDGAYDELRAEEL